MASERIISASVAAFARVLKGNVGPGLTLPVSRVADVTGVSDDTVINYGAGVTLPKLDWLIRFTAAFWPTHPALVQELWDALRPALGFRPDWELAMAPRTLDVNDDGKIDNDDARKWREKAAVGQVQNMAECTSPACVQKVAERDVESLVAINAAGQVEEHLRKRT